MKKPLITALKCCATENQTLRSSLGNCEVNRSLLRLVHARGSEKVES